MYIYAKAMLSLLYTVPNKHFNTHFNKLLIDCTSLYLYLCTRSLKVENYLKFILGETSRLNYHNQYKEADTRACDNLLKNVHDSIDLNVD